MLEGFDPRIGKLDPLDTGTGPDDVRERAAAAGSAKMSALACSIGTTVPPAASTASTMTACIAGRVLGSTAIR